MSILQAIILGVVEGLTEFLPISSTGHLVLVSDLLGILQTDYVKNFEVVIQLGAILAVVVLFWRRLITDWDIWKKIIVAFIPTGIIGFLLYGLVRDFLLGNMMVVISALFIGGLILVFLEKRFFIGGQTGESINYKQAILIGLAQAVAIVPGVSRSASTIIGGLFLGIKREVVVEFSFLLAIPTMLAASGLSLIKSADTLVEASLWPLIVGFIVSFLSALVAVKWLVGFVQKHNLVFFGYYRIILALVFFLFFLV